MFKDLIIPWLDSQNLKWFPSGNNYLVTQCPNPKHEDKHPSAFVSLDNGFIKCHSCGYYVAPSTFITDGNIKDTLLTQKFNNIIRKLEEQHEQQEMVIRNFMLPQRDEEIDEWRGFDKNFIDTVGIYISHTGAFKNRIIIPFYNVEGRLVGYTGRYIGDTNKYTPKYKHIKGISPSDHILFGKLIKDLRLDASELVVTEGAIDALRLLQVGIAATPSLGFRAPSDNFVLESITLGVDKIILSWDNDKQGLDKMLTITEDSLFSRWNCKLPTVLGTQHNKTKWLYKSGFKDFGEVPESLLRSIILKGIIWNF